MKICSVCGQEKQVCDFHKDKNTYDGFYPSCKLCRRERIKYLQQFPIIKKELKEFTKVCSRCNLEQDKSKFSKDKYKSDGFKIYCKSCSKIYAKEYLFVPVNREKRYNKQQEWRKNNKEYISRVHREYCKNNRDHIREYEAYRRNHDINFKLAKNLRRRINKKLNKKNRSISPIENLGCSLDEFKSYLESKFQPGMSWENYGQFGWHVDHIVALSKFNLTDPEQLQQACHYTNLQPLWWLENVQKGNK